MTNEKIVISYRHTIVYTNTEINAIGATSSTTLRTVTTHNDTNCKYVRKFGVDYEITEVTDIEDPVDVHLTITVKAADGTTLGSRVGGGAFVAGSTVTAQGCYIVASASGGVGTLPADIDITTDVDSPLNVVLTGEDIADGDSMNFYISSTGSTYYDSGMMYGGGRHTPDGTAQFPYFTITAALAALGGAFTIVTVLDSATYDEEIAISAGYTLQAALGQTPTITSGIGARITREVEHDGNNTDTCYVDALNGDDIAGDGTWQNPYASISVAYTNIGARLYINIKDSTSYMEDITISDIECIESIYGKTPTIFGSLIVENNNGDTYFPVVAGIIFNSNLTKNSGVYFQGDYSGASTSSVKNCTIKNYLRNGIGCVWGTTIEFQGVFERNIIYNCIYGIEYTKGDADLTDSGTIQKNIIYNNTYGIHISRVSGATAERTMYVDIKNNLLYANTYNLYGVGLGGPSGSLYYDGEISNNTICFGTYGIYFVTAIIPGVNCDIKKNILYDNDTDLACSGGGGAFTITYSGYAINSNFVIGAGCITTDPIFISTTSPYNFGLNSTSPCYKTAGAEDDMGVNSRLISISHDDISVNGFLLDGQHVINNCIAKSGATDYSGLIVKWCSIFNFCGIAIDDYSGTDTESSILNCSIHDNGNGIKFVRGGNTLQESIIYNNNIFGIHSNYTVQIFNHCVFYYNQYGIYFESESTNILIKNSIFKNNYSYGVYSETPVIIIYSNILDPLNSNVIYEPALEYFNITENPLFINENFGEEDFNIKTVYNGYLISSTCMDAADDGYDIGAYLLTRAVSDDSWRKYELAHNPRTIDFQNLPKGEIKFEDIVGSLDSYVKDMKRSFVFKWPATQYTTEELKDKIEYFNTLVKSRVNNFTDEDVKFRIQFLPTQKMDTGSAATVSAAGKSLTDQTQQWTENKWKGFWVGLEFTSGTGMVMDATAKTGTKSGAGWTTNQWAGYYLPLNGYWYYILSNTATVLTLSDPEETLEDETVAYSIEKYFRVNSNTSTVLYLDDDDGELVAGTYDYYIDFIECVVQKPEMKYTQKRYYYQQETWKNNFQIAFEEI